MPDGNRGSFHTTITVGFAVLIIVLFAVFVWDLSAQNTFQTQSKNEAAEKYARDAEEAIERDCIKREPAAMSECIKEVIESTHEAKQTQSDLIAQQGMEHWAWLMVVVSAISAGITGVGVVYVALTLKEARATTKAAVDGAEHARAAAEQARIGNEFSRERAERQFDPYLFVSEAKYTGPPENWPEGWPRDGHWITITIKNGSNWPAFVKERAHHSFYFINDFSAGGGGGGGSRGTQELKPDTTFPFVFGGVDDHVGAVENGKVFVGVRIGYDTLEGRRRIRDFWFEKKNLREKPEQWRLEEIDRPDLIDTLPDMYRGPWRKRQGMPTREDFEESHRYNQKYRA